MGGLTVAICTRNRAGLLPGVLESLCQADPPRVPGWEVVVVLNDCSDDSEIVARQFTDRLPLRLVNEPEAGHSVARNCAVKHARGDLILWTDDDTLVGKSWMRAYEDAQSRWPKADVFGGPIRPVFDEPTPDWMTAALPEIDSVYAARSADIEAPIEIARQPFGANYAIRAETQRRYLYDPRFGRAPGHSFRSGDEADVISRILKQGGEGRWVPSAVVDHRITRERQTQRYIRAYYVTYAKTVTLHDGSEAPSFWRLAAEARRVLVLEARYRASRLKHPPRRWSRNLREAALARGRWLGRCRLLFGGKNLRRE